ncbi:MAG: radical SAM protein [Candidatus Bathyarchaeia archaeon]|jgi:DNA repair photolyase|nr:radical SAM protein [Candidatus Bathyarchaeota archaeon A05DMB-3]
MQINYETIKCKNVLKNLGVLATRFWTKCSFDPYVNCELNCTYCNTGVSSNLDTGEGASTVYVKVNAPEILAKELNLLKRKAVLNMGVMVDPYQPAEANYRITRKILEVLKEYNCPFAIGTKSDLILRDLDLIAEASKNFHCCIALSITTMDEKLAKLLEPNAPTPQRRLEVLSELSKEGIMVGVWLTPIIPYITDTNRNIAYVIKAAKENGAKFILGGALDMRASHKFQSFLKENFAQYLTSYKKLYGWRNGISTYYPSDLYLWRLYKKFIFICQRYRVERYIPHFHTRKQALLFYLQNFSKFKDTPIFELTQILNYLPLSQDFLQIMQVKYGNHAFSKGLLKMLRYFPH